MLFNVNQCKIDKNTCTFYRAAECRHGLAMRILFSLSVRLCVRLYVCPSVKRVGCEITEERSVQIFNTARKIIVFREEERLVGANPSTVPEILGQPAPVERNRRF